MIKQKMLSMLVVYLLVWRLGAPPSAAAAQRPDYDQDDVDDRNLYPDDDDDEDEAADDDEEEGAAPAAAARATAAPARPVPRAAPLRRPARPPLDCYTCTYKAGQELNTCLDPVMYQAYTTTCHSADDKCFTSVEGASAQHVEMVVRGCRSACVQSPDWSCCQERRCNNISYQPPKQPSTGEFYQMLSGAVSAGAGGPLAPPPSVHFFISVLLLLQTVLKVLM